MSASAQGASHYPMPPVVTRYHDPTSTPKSRLISMRKEGAVVMVFIDDNGFIRLIRATRADEPELGVLTAGARAQVQSAVLAMHRLMRGETP